jgi:hypothetical protein
LTKQVIFLGDNPNDGTGTPLRTAMDYINQNFTDLYDNYQTEAGLSSNVAILTANNANSLGGVLAAKYVQNTDSRTLSGNLYFTGVNNYFNTAVYVGANVFVGSNVVINTAAYFVGNSTVNTSVAAGTISISGATINTTNFTGTANNASYVGSVIAANVVSNAQLVANLANYTNTSSLNTIIATFSANNANNLGTVPAANYVQNTDSRVLSGNLNFTGVNTYFSSAVRVGSNVVINTSTFYIGGSVVNSSLTSSSINIGSNATINTSALFIGDDSANVYVNKTGIYVNGILGGGGGYYKGNGGTYGDPKNANNLFRINSNTMSSDITIAEGENALTVGPMTINTGNTLIISTGGRVVII